MTEHVQNKEHTTSNKMQLCWPVRIRQTGELSKAGLSTESKSMQSRCIHSTVHRHSQGSSIDNANKFAMNVGLCAAADMRPFCC